ncbi:MAG: putative toxin-antitoxin system toxin component, PIN family [Candidatus Levybacteria bacterium]|nr:putative toxin-antitoxin system toxin component, PIN family [Candidatus Levybacteria bacterium]
MAKNLVRVVLDTNILVSAIGFGGKPAEIIASVLAEKIQAVTSPILLAELEEVLYKKLSLSKEAIDLTLEEIREEFTVVNPTKIIHVVEDEDDNRVLEAAVSANADYIVTGDSDLLRLKVFRKIVIITSDQFIKEVTSRL